jgi:hypothetical protein
MSTPLFQELSYITCCSMFFSVFSVLPFTPEHGSIIFLIMLIGLVCLIYLLLSVGPAESRLVHLSLSRLIVLNPVLVPPFIFRDTPRQTV